MSSQRPTPRWLPPIDVKWIAIAVALSAVTWVLVTPRYLPFQDIPNHVHLLEIDRDLDAPTTYLVRSDIHTLGYSLYIWLSRLSAPLFSASAVLRLLVLMTALGTPLAAGAVARALGISVPWAVLLALPLALSWPTRVGLVPYALAIPPALLATAAALRDEGSRRAPRARLLLAFFATLTYLAHAYVFACLCFVLLVAWGTVGAFGRRRLVTAALGIAPGIALSLHDLRQHAFDPIAATAVTLFHAPRWYRPAGLALSHLATRSYAITGPVMLLAFLPLLALLTTAALAAATGIGDVPRRGGRTFLILVAVAGSLGTLAIPESHGLVFLLASRTLVIGALFWTLLAAAAAERARGVRAALLALAPVVALGASLTEVSRRAREVEEVVGRNGPERVEGRYLTVQVPDCANASSLVWGGYDSFRHLWAYALGKNGVSPYLFSASRYQPIWYRGDTFREKLRGPPEHPMNENELPLETDACRTVGRERLLSATSWGEYDGVIVTKAGGGLEEALTPDQNRLVRHLAPGMAVVVGRPSSVRAFVDFGTAHARARLAQGWSGNEIVDERSVAWSDGPTSAVSLVMAPSDTPYVLILQGKGITAQAVAVSLNGHELGEVAIREAWERVHIFVERGIVTAGSNQLTFTYAKTVKPEAGDVRELGMLVDDLLLEPMGDPYVLPLGSPDARPHLLSGWGANEMAAGAPEVTASAARPRIGFVFRRFPRHTKIRVVGDWPKGRTLSLSLNHRPWGFLLETSPTTAELEVPPGALSTGWNELELSGGAADVEDEAPPGFALRQLELEDVHVRSLEVQPAVPDAKPFLAGGWSNPESTDGVTAVSTQGEVSTLRFAFDLPTSDHYLLGLRGRAADGRGVAGAAKESSSKAGGRARVAVSLNGQTLTSVDFGATWSLATVVLGAEVRSALAASHENLLELRAIDAGGGEAGETNGNSRPGPTQVTLREVLLVPVSESDEVDVGHPAHRRRLQNGWSGNEYIDGRSVVWTDGPSATLVFHVLPGATDGELDWEAHAYAPIAPVGVHLVMNGHRVGRIEVPANFRTGVVTVPRSALRAGVNVLELEPSATAEPAKVEQGSLDRRHLGVMFDRIALRPALPGR